MRYDNPQLADMLAVEYVLGTLKASTRARYEQLLQQRPDWQQTQTWWQAHIHLLADTVPAKNPPMRVWQNIENRLFSKQAINSATTPKSWWQNLAFLSGALSAAVVASFATFLILQSPKGVNINEPIAVAMLANPQAQSGWHLSLIKNSLSKNTQNEVFIRADSLASLETKPNNSFELWILPSDKSKPISLGLLPQQGNKLVKVPAQLVVLLNTSGLAVSLEPVGGSPTGQPTGAVLYQGKLVQI